MCGVRVGWRERGGGGRRGGVEREEVGGMCAEKEWALGGGRSNNNRTLQTHLTETDVADVMSNSEPKYIEL